MCKGLRDRYPENDLTPDELIKKHFPDVKVVPRAQKNLEKGSKK